MAYFNNQYDYLLKFFTSFFTKCVFKKLINMLYKYYIYITFNYNVKFNVKFM